MAMTKLEVAAKQQVMKRLGKQGYPTYARLLDKFDLNLTADPNVVGYMEVDRARIVLNKGLNIDQVSTIVRHEILHEYLTHFLRSNRWKEAHPDRKISHHTDNMAADYEISNVGYTDADKAVASAIRLNGQVLRGLVTEYDHPGWEDLTYEELLDKLSEQEQEDDEEMEIQITIGSRGDPSIQQAEDLERQANDVSKQLQGSGGGGGQQTPQQKQDQADAQDDVEQIKSDINGVKKDIEKNEQSKEGNGGPLETPQQQQQDAELQKRIADIKKALRDAMQQAKIVQETQDKIHQEKIAKKANDLYRYKDTPMTRFKDSLNKFIKKEVATGRGATWTRINKKYSGTGLIRPGTSRLALGHVPLINVYFDRSGSWDSQKTVKGQQAIATLNKYVQRGELKIKLYYFSNNVHSKEQDAINEGGTNGQPILEHIQATKPDNVIVLTDSDISDCESDVKVPGGVWMLFYGGRSQDLIDHLHGQKLTRYFDIKI